MIRSAAAALLIVGCYLLFGEDRVLLEDTGDGGVAWQRPSIS